MYDLKRIAKEFYEACEKADAPICCNMPVSFNNRFSRTLGRVTSRWNPETNKYVPTLVEFSRTFIENATDQNIKDVILHEAAHAIAIARTGKPHNHDAYFKSICAEIGTKNDGCATHVEKTIADKPMFKYTVRCKKCGEVVGGYSRRCKTVNHPGCYRCNKCHGELEVIQNW